jgi:hypothetical protein
MNGVEWLIPEVWEKPGPKIMADPQELQRRERGSARRALWKPSQPRRDRRERGMATLFKPLTFYLVELFQALTWAKPE